MDGLVGHHRKCNRLEGLAINTLLIHHTKGNGSKMLSQLIHETTIMNTASSDNDLFHIII